VSGHLRPDTAHEIFWEWDGDPEEARYYGDLPAEAFLWSCCRKDAETDGCRVARHVESTTQPVTYRTRNLRDFRALLDATEDVLKPLNINMPVVTASTVSARSRAEQSRSVDVVHDGPEDDGGDDEQGYNNEDDDEDEDEDDRPRENASYDPSNQINTTELSRLKRKGFPFHPTCQYCNLQFDPSDDPEGCCISHPGTNNPFPFHLNI